MRITSKRFSDDYYALSTIIGGKPFSITYSPSTDYDEAVEDFKKIARQRMKAFKRSVRSDTSPDTSAENK